VARHPVRGERERQTAKEGGDRGETKTSAFQSDVGERGTGNRNKKNASLGGSVVSGPKMFGEKGGLKWRPGPTL